MSNVLGSSQDPPPGPEPDHSGGPARWFLRCLTCREPWAVDAEHRPGDLLLAAVRARCPHCGAIPPTPRSTQGPDLLHGEHEIMGRIKSGFREGKRAPAKCDARCRNARGPHCDCPCGGASHGLGLLASLASPTTDGAPPALSLVNPPSEKVLARRKANRERRQAARTVKEVARAHREAVAENQARWIASEVARVTPPEPRLLEVSLQHGEAKAEIWGDGEVRVYCIGRSLDDERRRAYYNAWRYHRAFMIAWHEHRDQAAAKNAANLAISILNGGREVVPVEIRRIRRKPK